MKTTPDKLTQKLRAMSPEDLREMAANIVRILYLVHDEENDPPVLDSEKEWDGDTLGNIAADIEDANLSVEHIAAFQPPAPVGIAAPVSRFHAFHWPDHVIGKRESRRIRDDHNALFNSHHELLTALAFVLPSIRGAYEQDSDWSGDLAMVENAIERATRTT